MAWFEMEWNNPSRTDYYLMRLALYMRRSGGTLDDMAIQFERAERPSRKGNVISRTTRSMADRAKAAWAMRLGNTRKKIDDGS